MGPGESGRPGRGALDAAMELARSLAAAHPSPSPPPNASSTKVARCRSPPPWASNATPSLCSSPPQTAGRGWPPSWRSVPPPSRAADHPAADVARVEPVARARTRTRGYPRSWCSVSATVSSVRTVSSVGRSLSFTLIRSTPSSTARLTATFSSSGPRWI